MYPGWAVYLCLVLALTVSTPVGGVAFAAPATPAAGASADGCMGQVPPANGPQAAVLQSVVFDGVRKLRPAALQAIWASCVGKTVTFDDLKLIARKTEAAYAKRGYPFVAVVIPPQDISDGVVHFKVLEGRIASITYLGADTEARRQAAAVFATLLNKQPVSTDDFDSAFLRSKQIPGLTATGTLGPSSQNGEMELVVATKRQEWTTYANANNDYAPALGIWAVTLAAERAGGSIYGDLATAQILASPDFQRQVNLRAGYTRGLDATGTSAGVYVLVSEAKPTGAFSDLAIVTNAVNARAELNQVLFQQPISTVTATLGLEVNNQSTSVFSNTQIGRDRLRILSARLSGDSTSALGYGVWQVEVRQGLSILGASRAGDSLLSHFSADPDATIVKGSAEFDTAPWHGMQLAAKLQGQSAAHAVLVPEQFAVGNLSIVRGFDPGALLADRALAGGLEMRTPPLFSRGEAKVSAFAFVEGAQLWTLSPASSRWAASDGGGIRVDLPNRLRMEVAFVDPHPIAGVRAPARLLVNITTELNPLGSALGHLMSTFSRVST